MSTTDEYEMTSQIKLNQPAQYMEFEQSDGQSRKQFLIKFHATQIIQFIIVLAILGMMSWVCDIFVAQNENYLPEYYTTYNEYREQFGFNKSYRDFLKWRQPYVWIENSLKWEFYFVLTILTFFSITIMMGRKEYQIIRFQKTLFIAQSVLGGLFLTGFLSIYMSIKYYYAIWLSIFSLISLIFNNLLIIILIKKDRCAVYQTYIPIIISLYLFLICYFVLRDWIYHLAIIEIVVIYVIYFYGKLNNQLLKDQKKIKNYSHLLIQLLQNRQIESDSEKVENQKLLTKILIFHIGVFVFFLLSIVFYVIFGQTIFLLITIICLVDFMGLVFDTQVASKVLFYLKRLWILTTNILQYVSVQLISQIH